MTTPLKRQLTVIEVHNLKSAMANLAAEAFQYYSWSDKFCKDNIVNTTQSYIDKYTTDLDFTQADLEDIGFSMWDEESNLMLVPLWLLPFISTGVELTDITGKTSIVGTDTIDNDVRFGCLAYGVYANDREQ